MIQIWREHDNLGARPIWSGGCSEDISESVNDELLGLTDVDLPSSWSKSAACQSRLSPRWTTLRGIVVSRSSVRTVQSGSWPLSLSGCVGSSDGWGWVTHAGDRIRVGVSGSGGGQACGHVGSRRVVSADAGDQGPRVSGVDDRTWAQRGRAGRPPRAPCPGSVLDQTMRAVRVAGVSPSAEVCPVAVPNPPAPVHTPWPSKPQAPTATPEQAAERQRLIRELLGQEEPGALRRSWLTA